MPAPKASGSGTQRFRSLAFANPEQSTGRPAGSVVLLTGFGPFPGVERNASSELAMQLARLAARRHCDFQFAAEVLPVDWGQAPLQVADLLRRYQPEVALHFGVSVRARGFVIETHAYNETKDAPDDNGQTAQSMHLVLGDRPRRSATLPVKKIVQTLHRAGFPAELSSDPGRYLCNAVLFHSLRHAGRTQPKTRTGFIHVPAALAPGNSGETSLITWNEAVEGGLRLIEACVPSLRPGDRTLS
jgi:pyroglutamyl-peptidase